MEKDMETRTYTAVFSVGDSVRIERPIYELTHETPDPFKGMTGKVKSVIFPGDVLYENWGLPNGTGEVKYLVVLDKPHCGYTDFLFSDNELQRL